MPMQQIPSHPPTDDPDHPLDNPLEQPGDNPHEAPGKNRQSPPWRNPAEELPGGDGHDPDNRHPRDDKLQVD